VFVTRVVGFDAQVAPGWLLAHQDPTRLLLEYPGSVRVEDSVVVFWKSGDEEHSKRFSREELGLPRKISDLTLRFTYDSGGCWRVERLRRASARDTTSGAR
jgi:hypothetical protein